MKLLVALTSGAMAQFGIGNFGADFGAPASSSFAIPSSDTLNFDNLNLGPPAAESVALPFDNFGPPPAAPAAPVAAPAEPEAPVEELPSDLGALDLADLFGSFESTEEEDSERYGVFTTTPTPPPTTPPGGIIKFDLGFDCWKCDRMSFEQCAIQGEWNACPAGDYNVCFMELRETENNIQQVCTGCKDGMACENLRQNNFQSSGPTAFDQCRPTTQQQQARGRFNKGKQSVCRTCFNTCDHDSASHDPKLWCPTFMKADDSVNLFDEADNSADRDSFMIPQWNRVARWQLGTSAAHSAHKDDTNFWRVDLVATQMTNLNTDIATSTVDKSDFDGDVDYNDDGSINQNNSG